jgi:hypothetical protein
MSTDQVRDDPDGEVAVRLAAVAAAAAIGLLHVLMIAAAAIVGAGAAGRGVALSPPGGPR